MGLRDVGDPVELAQYYSDGGADELVFLDIAATPDDSKTMTSVVEQVADVLQIPFTVGGGVEYVCCGEPFSPRRRSGGPPTSTASPSGSVNCTSS